MIFVDSSVWISALRDAKSSEARELTRLLDSDEVALSIPVYLEILTGATRANRSRLRRVLSALPVFHPSRETWTRVEQWIPLATDRGHRFGVMDLLIASIAADWRGRLWSLDEDFRRMARLEFVELFRPDAASAG
ncbi:MAG: PIN domain-containing protein [Acidobacteriota bacterium]|nr:PIN domain-containing protein [Acidobacteriota bacterium]MDQ5871069.1 PIN domain-containing protein [Acidobacteriota bacterium]